MRLVLLILLYAFINNVFAQNKIEGRVVDEHSGEPLPGVNIRIAELNTGTSTGDDGSFIIDKIPDGTFSLLITYIGFRDISEEIVLPADAGKQFVFEMEEEAEELEEITVASGRASRTIRDIPTRIEVIAAEELEEKISMDPSNISMVLNESSGIYVQPTSAVSGNSTISIQGLEGRYTQILKDGFPLFGGYSGTLSVMQIPPVDLKQVEVIKGSASALYGAGAIAGLINLISKEPSEQEEKVLLYNMSSAGAIDASGFYSGRFNKLGLTLSASSNQQKRYDADDDQFTDLPHISKQVIEPKLYYYFSGNAYAMAGLGLFFEDRTGGFIGAIDNNDADAAYIEKNRSRRITTQLKIETPVFNGDRLVFKNSFSRFNRSVTLRLNGFSGYSLSSYSELSYQKNFNTHNIVAGITYQTEAFNEEAAINPARNYSFNTTGAFLQDIWSITNNAGAELGIRGDYNSIHGFFLLPKISAIYKFSDNLSLRAGGGLGYSVPTIFMEESERAGFVNVLPLKPGITAEKSAGISIDINYRTILFNQLSFSLNQAFYYTNITSPLTVNADSAARGFIFYENLDGHVSTSGFETNLKFNFHDFKLYAFYTYIYARENFNSTSRDLELTPHHKLGTTFFWEKHENFRIGLEAYYTGRQVLSTGSSRPYWVTGLMAEKHFGFLTLFINFENFTDTRQSRFEKVVTGTRTNPVFSELWAPLEGFVINGGVKLKF